MLVRRKWISSRPQMATGLVGKQDVKRVRSRFSLCSLVLVAGLGMAIVSDPARALGLGDIEVRSALNQPLDAEISLLSVKADDASRINVKLADDIAYLTSGIERTASLSQLAFSVGTGAGGKTVVKVVSQDPIKEPFLDFIIEINWPNGRLLREYTILLDPPVFAGDSSASIAAPSRGRSSFDSPPEPISPSAVTPRSTANSSPAATQTGASSVTSSKRVPTSAQTSGPGAGEYKVKPSESLRSIADSINPNSNDYSSEQVMMAMYRLNPDAFFDDNINNLKKGYVLRAPDEAQVAESSRSDAAKQAREHYDRWLQRRKVKNAAAPDKVGSEAGLAAMGDAAKPSVRKQSKPDAQLRLLSPEEGDSLGAGGQAKAKGAGAAADKEIVELENRELKDQISSLKEQLATMERLITLKTDAMVELQKKAGTDAKEPSSATGSPPAETPTEATPVAPAPQTQANTPNPAQAPAASQPAKKVRDQKTQPETVESSWIDALMEPRLLAMLVGVVLLLGAGVWMFLRRRREANESEFEMPFDEESAAPVEIKLPTSNRRAAPAIAEPMPDSGLDFGNGSGYQSAGLETFETDESEIDPIAEADVYLAYRRFQQAEDLIRDALKREPQREELHLKMLEIYFGSGNKEGFEAQAEALYAILGGAETDTWHKVVSMGQELCPDHPLFGSGGEPALAAPAQSSVGPRSTGAVVTAADQYAPLWQEDSSVNEAMDEASAESSPFAGYDDGAGKSARGVSDDHVMSFDPAATKSGSVMKSGRDERVSESASVARENAMDFDLSGFAFDKPANNGGHDDSAESHDSVADFDFSKMDHGNFDTDLSASDDAIGKRARSEHELDTALQGLGHNLGEGDEVFTGLDDVGLGDEGDDDLFSGADMVSTKLDLARAYIDMDDREGARGILSEVLEEGNNSQKQEATELMRKLG